MPDTNVGMNIVGRDRATGAIESVRKSLGGLEGAAGLATKGLAGIAGAFGAGMLLQFGRQVAGAVVEMGQLAAQSDMVAGSMRGLAASFGQSGDAMLAALKRASMGTIAEYDLMLGANKAMMLGVAQNADELEGIMKVALSRGAAMGLSTTQAFDNLVTGLGRGSALILDNLGITMDSLRVAEEEYATTVGKTTDALSDQEKKQAMVNAVLKEAEGIDLSNIAGAAQGFAGMSAAMADLKVAMGEAFGPLLQTAVQALTTGVRAIDGALESMSAPPVISTLDEQLAAQIRQVKALREEWRAMAQDIPEEDLARVYELQDRMEFTDTGLAGVPLELQQYVTQLDSLVAAETRLYRLREQAAIAPKIEALAGSYSTGAEIKAAYDAVRAAEAEAAAVQAVADKRAYLAAQTAALEAAMIPGTQAWKQHTQAMLDYAAAAAAVEAVQQDQLAQTAERMASAYPAAAQGAELLASHLDVAAQVTGTAQQIAASLVDTLGPAGAAGEVANITQLLYAQVGAWEAEGVPIGFITGVLLPDYAAKLIGINGLLGAAIANTAALGAKIDALASVYPSASDGSQALQVAREYRDTLGGIASGTVNALGPKGTLGWLKQNNQALYEQVSAWEAAGYEMDYIQGTLMPAYLSDLRTSVGELNTTAGLTAKGQQNIAGMATGAQTAAQAFSDLRGKVQSALSGALDAGVSPDAFLPREDAINENARRLADIMVNGFKGQDWLGEFQAEVPDVYQALIDSGNPQQAAAQMLQNFEDGLVPGLIDKEAVKEKVKRALIGETNMAALAQEITAELAAELGQNPAQLTGLVNTAMGRGTEDTDLNGEVLTQLKSQSFLNGVNKAGFDAGTNWGTAFLAIVGTNVPAELLGILATLVTPLVSAQLANDGERQGAQ